jgi:putative ABC transport system substrate-binding protein
MIATDYDPLELGYVESLAQPGGNVTGVFFRQVALTEKRLELIRETLASPNGVTIFWDQNSADQWERAQIAAARHGVPIYGVELRDRPYDYERAIDEAPPEYQEGLMVLASPLFSLPTRETLIEFSSRRRLPTIYPNRFFPDAGGLMSYGVSFTILFRRAADFVDKIAKGASPLSLPVEQPANYELVVNLQTAAGLDLEIPESILLRADDVIE